MLKLSCAVLAAVGWVVLSGCSSSASDPAVASASAAPPPPAAPAPAESGAGVPAESPGLSSVQNSVPPSLAPLGPIPGPRIEGENPATTIENPYADNPTALEEGRQLFVQMNCAGCHGGHAGGGMGPNLRSPKEWLYGNTPAELFDSISEGRGKGMPAWGMKLPPEVIWKLVAYIQSLGTPQEPDKAAPAPAHAPESAAAQVY